jgi:hypothetical protein
MFGDLRLTEIINAGEINQYPEKITVAHIVEEEFLNNIYNDFKKRVIKEQQIIEDSYKDLKDTPEWDQVPKEIEQANSSKTDLAEKCLLRHINSHITNHDFVYEPSGKNKDLKQQVYDAMQQISEKKSEALTEQFEWLYKKIKIVTVSPDETIKKHTATIGNQIQKKLYIEATNQQRLGPGPSAYATTNLFTVNTIEIKGSKTKKLVWKGEFDASPGDIIEFKVNQIIHIGDAINKSIYEAFSTNEHAYLLRSLKEKESPESMVIKRNDGMLVNYHKAD